MFCDNVSYQTDRQQNCANYCAPKSHQVPVQSFQYIQTEHSQRNPSNVLKSNLLPKQYLQEPEMSKNVSRVRAVDTMELVQENARKDQKRLQIVERNKKISAILSIVLAFSQRCQALKEKLCGYSADSFSPVEFFNVLDITEKGYVDLYDIKRFVNNEKIREKDIIALFKRINGDHSKDNTKLSYFGYLNLIKPYFNEELARDLLLRDSAWKNKRLKGLSNSGSKITGQMIEPTQQSVLLLFQQLMLLHCICATEHQQAKELLMNEYMLNTLEIKQILGLSSGGVETENSKMLSQKNMSRVRHKTTLSIMFDFIENNSQFEIEFSEMKLLLAFLNCHQFSLTNDKYISLLFLPTNCKEQILKELNKKKEEIANYQDTQNYMNTYLTKENLINRGNIQVIKDYLDEKTHYSQNQHQAKLIGSTLGVTSKANFLEFVHPRSLQRVNQPYQDSNLISQGISPQQLPSPHLPTEHPQFQVSASNKYVSNNLSGGYNPLKASGRQNSNSSSIPQQNIKVIPPKASFHLKDHQASQRHQYQQRQSIKKNPSVNYHQGHQGLKHEFYQNEREDEQNVNLSKISNTSKTPFLEQFMKKDNILQKYHKESQNPAEFRRKVIHQENSRIQQSGFSESAFQVVDYGYESSKINHYNARKQEQRKYADETQKIKKETLDSRYNMVISQYQNKNTPQNQSSGPKFEKSINKNSVRYKKSILQHSKGNVIDSIGLSHSNVVNESNLINKFSIGGGNILNQFLKKA